MDKVLNRFNVKFDEDLAKPSIEKTIKELSKVKFEEIEDDPKIKEMLHDLKSHIDKRLVEIWERPNLQIVDSNLKAKRILVQAESQETYHASYTIKIEIKLPEFKSEQIIEIKEIDTFTDTLTSIYFLLSDYIDPFTYLEKWIIRDMDSGKSIVIREVGDMIPARYIFQPSLKLEVVKLDMPYH